ncbi:MAG TPA: hypothetical protein VGQ94_04075 [Terriglobales bacterium]|nr:hypothetical protein [Terriglobales bacterium]
MLDQTVDPRVPFLVKLAGQQQEVVYHAPLRSLVAHDLTLALLRGELSQPAEVTRWFDQRVMSAPSSGLPGAEARPHPAGSQR